jgi:prefoldin subunit 5
MIENHMQFQVTQEQIQRLEQALEHIRRMRAEIDVYLVVLGRSMHTTGPMVS